MSAGHRIDAFDCGKSALNLWLVRYARQVQTSGSGKTFVAADEACIAGYYSLTVGQVDTTDAPDRVRQGMGQYPIPIVILARLAVSLTYQGQGIGLALIRDTIRRTLAIAEQADIRALLTHPIDDDATHFCARFGL